MPHGGQVCEPVTACERRGTVGKKKYSVHHKTENRITQKEGNKKKDFSWPFFSNVVVKKILLQIAHVQKEAKDLQKYTLKGGKSNDDI